MWNILLNLVIYIILLYNSPPIFPNGILGYLVGRRMKLTILVNLILYLQKYICKNFVDKYFVTNLVLIRKLDKKNLLATCLFWIVIN